MCVINACYRIFSQSSPKDNSDALRHPIESRKYVLKNFDEIFNPSTADSSIAKYIIAVKIPRGKSHYNNLIAAFERLGATKTETEWGTLISESRRERIGDFLREELSDTLAIYFGSLGLVVAIIFHLNHFTHGSNLFYERGSDWLILIGEAAIPSRAYIAAAYKNYRLRYGNHNDAQKFARDSGDKT